MTVWPYGRIAGQLKSPHQGEEVPAEGDADLGEALDGVDDDKDLGDEDLNTTEDIIALEPSIPLKENGKEIMDILDNVNDDTIDNTNNDNIDNLENLDSS